MKSYTGNLYNPIRYKGYYYDEDVEMYYCKSRFYVPEWCRWLIYDSSQYLDIENVGCANLFAYCNNNPVMYLDGDGHAPQWLGWLLTGAALVGLTALSVFTFGAAAPISGVAAGVIIGATCGAYAGTITSVVSQGINSGWSNIDSWNVFKETRVGLVSGAISGLGVGIGTSILTGGISQITSGLFDGSISSFSDALCQFAYGALISGVTYGLGKFISNKMATSKIGGIIGTSSKNSVINKRLADAGFSNLKVGVKGLSGVVKELYNYYGYSAVSSLLSNGSSALISILGGIF